MKKQQPTNIKEFVGNTIVKYLKERDDELNTIIKSRDDWIRVATKDLSCGVCDTCCCPINRHRQFFYSCNMCNTEWCYDCKGGITNPNIRTKYNDCKKCYLDIHTTHYFPIESICFDCLTPSELLKLQEKYPKCKCLDRQFFEINRL